ncbi:MAG: excinuclease ABC subunit UvrC [Vicinamibacteria bacterium]|nr:excinuclease ABC subunit UvrC [Vicinamibacteria bacterium]
MSDVPLRKLDDKLEQLPASPGVYLFKNAEGGVLYVGKARVLKNRVRSYFQAGHEGTFHKASMVAEIADLDILVTDSEGEALALENNLIKRHQPPYNVLLRDDKNHPYLKLTLSEAYPRLHIVRKVAEDKSAYGGPYIPAHLGRKTASLVHRVFGVRSCREKLDGHRGRPCLQYQIHRCLAPCVATLCSIDEYRKSCVEAAKFLEGRTDEVLKDLRASMMKAAEEELFEHAATVRDSIQALERMDLPQKITTAEIDERDIFGIHFEEGRASLQVFCVRDGRVASSEGFLLDRVGDATRILEESVARFYEGDRYVPREVLIPEAFEGMDALTTWLAARRGSQVRFRVPQRGEKVRLLELVTGNAKLAHDLEWRHPKKRSREILISLMEALGLPDEPRRIECFDISNLQGSDIVASLVVFEMAAPKKSDYRTFKVKTVVGAPDDFASMREVVGRRYRRLLEEGSDLPDLVLIDGGPGQLSAAAEALDELGLGELPLASLAKREEILHVRGREAPVALDHSAPALQLMQAVRDEAHRFAVTFHRKRRAKRTIASELNAINGVGPKARSKLLRAFGSLKGVKAATLAELAAVVGPSLAGRIVIHQRAEKA